jgi:hypothetical protein
MIQRLQPAYFFMLECFFLYFLVFVFYTRSGEIPSIPAILSIIIGGNLFLYLVSKKNIVNNGIPFICAILLSGIAYFLGFSIMSIVLCAVFLYFRISSFIKDSSLWKEERTNLAIVFYSSSILVFFIGWIFRYPYMNVLFGMVIAFTVLYSIGRFLQQTGDHFEARDVLGLSSALFIAVVLTVLGTLLIPGVKFVFIKIFSGLAVIASIIGSPIFALIEGIILGIKSPESPDDPFAQGEVGDRKETYEKIIPVEGIPSWFWLVLLVVLLIIIWVIIKRKSKIVDKEIQESSQIKLEHIPLSVKMGRKRKFFRSPSPHEYMRKLVFHLDEYASKYHLGRYPNETVREWFERVEFQKNEDLFAAYESVRYGNIDIVLDKHDAQRFEDMILKIKKEIKDRNNKKKG